jgi:hypothetical protein
VAVLVLVGAARVAAGDPVVVPEQARFAVIVGVNASPSSQLSPLVYADDDAARYLELFRTLGARTILLSRLDPSTTRLHPQAAAEAWAPVASQLRQALALLHREMAEARRRGVPTTLYFVYAGHGEVRDDETYLTLEDRPLPGKELLELLDASPADQVHVIVDACQAYLLAHARGAGGRRRPARGFVALESAVNARRMGFLLSSSSSGETHEWAGFEAGVFSHEVRSGLYGAADANGDGQVTYSEMVAFVDRANEPVRNDRFRPQIFAQPPARGDLLVDLSRSFTGQLRLRGAGTSAHHFLEDSRGVRVADFHASPGSAVRLVRPGMGVLFLRRPGDPRETVVPASWRTDEIVELDDLPRSPSQASTRGAAHEAFSQIFSLPFDQGSVELLRRRRAEAELAAHAFDQAERRTSWRRAGATAAWVASGAALAAGTASLISAYDLSNGIGPQDSHQIVNDRNARIRSRNRWGGGLLITAGAAAAAGALLWPWSTGGEGVSVALSPRRVELGAHWRF